MEKSTIIGLILGITAVLVGMIMKGAHLTSLLVPAAFMIIFVGTAATLFIGFPMSELKNFPILIKKVFVEQKLLPKKQIISLFMEWASITRREGLLALETNVEEIDDPFLKNGMRMI